MTEILATAVLIAARLMPVMVVLIPAMVATRQRHWSLATVLMLTLMLTPMLTGRTVVPSRATWLATLSGEVVLGLSLGLGCAILMVGLQLTGHLFGQLGGAGWNATVSMPDGEQASLSSQYFGLLSVTLLVASGAYRDLIDVLLLSFRMVPPGDSLPRVDALSLLRDLLQQNLMLGVRAAAPILFCLLVVNGVLAILARGMPFLGAFGLSVTLNFLVALLALWASLPVLVSLYRGQWSAGLALLVDAMRRAVGG